MSDCPYCEIEHARKEHNLECYQTAAARVDELEAIVKGRDKELQTIRERLLQFVHEIDASWNEHYGIAERLADWIRETFKEKTA